MSAAPAIEARDLRFRYPGRAGEAAGPRFELRLDDWQVAAGDRVALHGPSGCGKSTLLDLVAGSLVADSGRLLVEGHDLTAISDAQRRAHRIRTIGFVFQDFPLLDYLEAEENVVLPYRLDPQLRLDAPVRERARDLLAGLGLGDKRGRLPGELSQGERQRVAIARALVTQPRLLLADEPTAGLDPDQSRRVLETLERLCEERGLTLLFVTHDPSLLARFDHAVAVAGWTTGAS
ncbi:MAG: ABC transporter ATP-binding protein [Thermoanaerobaculia bacterium]|nr:ABC transporter ATP-binding protein [Thermoanaerobaculia bacterium]